MNSMQLSCFVEVASTLSFSKAAENLHVSQPTVSHQVKALEDELRVALLTRSTRTVRLTEEGHVLLGYAYDILELEARARNQVSQGRVRGAHELRVGVSAGLEAQIIAPALGRLHREDAAFDPTVRLGSYSALNEVLENGSVDVVLAYRDPAGEPAGATVFRRLFEADVVCVCADDHALSRTQASSVTAEELLAAGRIAVANPHTAPAAIVQAQRAIGIRLNERQVMMCASTEIALALASSGIAYTLMPGIPAMHRPGLRFIPVEGADPIVLGVRVRRGRRRALLDRFIAVLGEELQREQAASVPTDPAAPAEPAAPTEPAVVRVL